MKVYLATSGEYSDYYIQAVFRNREDAEKCPLADDVDERELQEGPLDVRFWYSLTWWDGQAAAGFEEPSIMSWLAIFDGREGHAEHRWDGPPDRIGDVLNVTGWDQKRVFKVYSEQRAQYLAQKAGL